MSPDAGERLDAPRPDFALPKVLDIQVRGTTFHAPRHRNFTSALPSGDGVEFIVKTDGPIPGRALGPALYVGETVVTEVSTIGENIYRFVAPRRDDLKLDAPITLSWTGQAPKGAIDPAFRYRPKKR
jgi:hypothetical protein